MHTEIVPFKDKTVGSKTLRKLVALRSMSSGDWIDRYASGTLRKNKRLGMSWRSQYLEERIAWEFGWEFECVPRSRIEWGDAITEGDCHSVTEAGWHIDRYIERSVFPEDYFECKHITVSYGDDTTRRGLGIIVRQTSAAFVPRGHIVFAIVAEYADDAWKPARNPF